MLLLPVNTAQDGTAVYLPIYCVRHAGGKKLSASLTCSVAAYHTLVITSVPCVVMSERCARLSFSVAAYYIVGDHKRPMHGRVRLPSASLSTRPTAYCTVGDHECPMHGDVCAA